MVTTCIAYRVRSTCIYYVCSSVSPRSNLSRALMEQYSGSLPHMEIICEEGHRSRMNDVPSRHSAQIGTNNRVSAVLKPGGFRNMTRARLLCNRWLKPGADSSTCSCNAHSPRKDISGTTSHLVECHSEGCDCRREARRIYLLTLLPSPWYRGHTCCLVYTSVEGKALTLGYDGHVFSSSALS